MSKWLGCPTVSCINDRCDTGCIRLADILMISISHWGLFPADHGLIQTELVRYQKMLWLEWVKNKSYLGNKAA